MGIGVTLSVFGNVRLVQDQRNRMHTEEVNEWRKAVNHHVDG